MKRRYNIIIIAILLLATFLISCSDKSEEIDSSGNKKIKASQKEKKVEEPKIILNEITISVEGKTIYGRMYAPNDKEKHPAIILSHGYNGTNSDFIKECRYYAENGYVAYTYDFCGGSVNSKSTGKSTDMTIFTEKADLMDVFNYISKLDNVDSNNVYLMGGSQGGLVTTLVAEELKEKVKGMVLYFPALCIAEDWRKTYPNVSDIPETQEFWGLKLGKVFFESIHDFKIFDTIGNYPNKVLIIQGDKDSVVSMDDSNKLATMYPDCDLVVFEGEGHGFSVNGNKKAMELTLDFMKN